MASGTWALRETRAVYHPWYAEPGRMFLNMVVLGILAGWLAARLGALLPARAHGPRHPILVWSFTLPLWVVLAGVTGAFSPSASYLWTVPLLVAGAALLSIPVGNAIAVRVASVVVLAVSGALWLPNTGDLLRFTVAVFGRLPMITPVWVYAALMAAAGAMVAPPLIAAVAATRPIIRPGLVTAALLVAAVVTGGLTYAAPAYTFAQPQRRAARVFVEPDAATATYEVASQEPGLDLAPGAPANWRRVTDTAPGSLPFPRFGQPFVFRTTTSTPGPAPAAITDFSLKAVAAGTELMMTVVPRAPGLTVAFMLPEGIVPARTSLPGLVWRGRWRAAYVGVPMAGLTWRASFKSGSESALPSAAAVVSSPRFPGGEGWQSLPAWLPQEHAVWHMEVAWVLKTPPVIPPVPPLR